MTIPNTTTFDHGTHHAWVGGGVGWDVDVHLCTSVISMMLRHAWVGVGCGGMLTSTCTSVISMMLRHAWFGVGCGGMLTSTCTSVISMKTDHEDRLAPSKSHVDPLAMQRLLDKPGLEILPSINHEIRIPFKQYFLDVAPSQQQ